jgi:c-di-GMP-binding flagellar brake protein YcgR
VQDWMDSADEKERRRYLRIPLEVAVQCHLIRDGKPGDAFDGRSMNFSAGGLSLRGPQALPEGETLVVSFSLPEKPSAGGISNPLTRLNRRKTRLLAMRAKVVWCSRQEAGDYDLGMQFVTVDDYAHRPLIYFLQDYQL